MRPEEDKDIKVFHPSNEKKEQAEESTDLSQDILHAVQELDAQRSNGNLRRARKLGRSLAQFTPENAAKLGGIDIKAKGGVDPQELPSNVLYQARVLMLFTAQLTLHRLLPPVISNEAVNAMYDDLSEGFYDNVMEGRFVFDILSRCQKDVQHQRKYRKGLRDALRRRGFRRIRENRNAGLQSVGRICHPTGQRSGI